jgi:dTDP-4-dehydrorhamnose 3,5-epimerase
MLAAYSKAMAEPDLLKFEPTTVEGAMLITPQRIEDERGFFARTWCAREFEAHGLPTTFVQRNLSHTRSTGTLRGMHFQQPPHAEAKLVTCLAGAIFDVAVDLRPESASYGQWFGAELSGDRGNMLLVPEGCAHGFITLTPDATVEYLMSEFYQAEAATGVRWDDPFFKILWPVPPTQMSERDRTWPDYEPVRMAGQPSTRATGVGA